MRIVQICPYDMARPGGVQAHIRALSGWLCAHGHEVRIIAPHAVAGVEADDIEPCGRGTPISLFGTRFEVTYARAAERRKLVSRLRDWGAEVVHLHTPWTPLMAWQVWRDLELPTVSTFHATLPEKTEAGVSGRLLRAAARYFLIRSRALVVPSEAPLRHLRPDAVGVAAEVLPPSIDLSPWERAGSLAQKDQPDVLRLVFLGRFEARKGLDGLLAAWPSIASRLPDARLTIAGGGQLRPLVQKAMAQVDGDRITLVDTPDDDTARRLIAEADMMIAPAPYGESFGIVLIEAMAAGALPIAAANPGYSTVLTGIGTQLLVPPGDVQALADRVVWLARDDDARARLRAWALPHGLSFGVAATGPRFVELYRRALMPD